MYKLWGTNKVKGVELLAQATVLTGTSASCGRDMCVD